MHVAHQRMRPTSTSPRRVEGVVTGAPAVGPTDSAAGIATTRGRDGARDGLGAEDAKAIARKAFARSPWPWLTRYNGRERRRNQPVSSTSAGSGGAA